MELKQLLAEAILEANEDLREERLREFKYAVRRVIDEISSNEARKARLKTEYAKKVIALEEANKELRASLKEIEYTEHINVTLPE